MHSTDVAIIGGGQAGLAMSRCLTDRTVDHVVFERGDVAERWRTHAWDSLRLLTPNWLNELPGLAYDGDEPEAFMPRDGFVARLSAYAASFCAPVQTGTDVVSVERQSRDFLLRTSKGSWRARAVVVATGHCDIASMPAFARHLDPRAVALHSSQYRSPAALPDGDVLVVGASASGVQISDELQRSGRQVTLAVGRHTRLPRTWRGRDIHWWLHRTGMLAQRTVELSNPEAAMREPAPQLAGRPDRADVDLASLQHAGIRLAGRLAAVEAGTLTFAEDLDRSISQADAKQRRVLDEIDAFAGLVSHIPNETPRTVDLTRPAPRRLSLRDDRIGTVIWATGYRRDFSWLKLLLHTPDGEIAHSDGVTLEPGVFALGFRLLRKRDSHFIGGVGTDAEAIAGEVSAFLGSRGRRAA
jgi:putative flavoprotein involved in K+ transport